jgi:hypothetical protein
LSVSPSADMLPFGVTIPATVPQRAEIPEGRMNYPVSLYIYSDIDKYSNDIGNEKRVLLLVLPKRNTRKYKICVR